MLSKRHRVAEAGGGIWPVLMGCVDSSKSNYFNCDWGKCYYSNTAVDGSCEGRRAAESSQVLSPIPEYPSTACSEEEGKLGDSFRHTE